MSETLEHAREGIERAHHAHVHEGDEAARWIAVLTALLAAGLAISELGEKASMREFLARHIALSDDYNYYQEKHVRLTIQQTEEAVLASLPGASEPAIQQRIAESRREQQRLQDNPATGQGMKQLLQKADAEKVLRDEAEHRAHRLEIVVGGLQIAIVLASVSVVTRVRWLAWGATGLGAAMAALGIAVWSGTI